MNIQIFSLTEQIIKIIQEQWTYVTISAQLQYLILLTLPFIKKTEAVSTTIPFIKKTN